MGVQDAWPAQEAINVAAEIAFWLSSAAERGEWHLAPAAILGRITELGRDCIGPEGKSPQEAVRDYIEAARELAEDENAA